MSDCAHCQTVLPRCPIELPAHNSTSHRGAARAHKSGLRNAQPLIKRNFGRTERDTESALRRVVLLSRTRRGIPLRTSGAIYGANNSEIRARLYRARDLAAHSRNFLFVDAASWHCARKRGARRISPRRGGKSFIRTGSARGGNATSQGSPLQEPTRARPSHPRESFRSCSTVCSVQFSACRFR